MASFIALQDNGNSYVASKLRNRITVASSRSTHKDQYILLMELKITGTYQGYSGIWSMIDNENNTCGTLAIKIRNDSPITSFPSATTEISWLNLKKYGSAMSAPIIIATKEESDIDADSPYIIIKLYFQPKRIYITALFSIIQESYNCQILQKISYPTEASYVDNYQGTLLCTSNVIMDNYNSYINADSATKLYTARTIGITGGATGTATSFDGSSDINIPITALAPESISEGYTKNRFFLQTSVESTGVVIPYLYNDLAHLLKKGGSVDVYYDDTLASTDVTQVFETGFSYWSKTTSGLTSITFEITLHETFTYSNVFWVDSEADSQRAKNIKVEVMNSQYENDVWTKKAEVTNHSESGYYLLLTHTPVGASNTSGGFDKIRITFSNFNDTTFRVGNIGLLKRNGNGIGEVCLSRGGADMYGSITCFKDKTYNLGSSDKKWKNIYTYKINNIPSSLYLNPKNYLDNSDFTNPINQREQTTYTGSNLYTIDRWICRVDNGTLTVNAGESITLTSTNTASAYWSCYLDNDTANSLKGKKVTIAAMTLEDGLFITSATIPETFTAGTNLGQQVLTNGFIRIQIMSTGYLGMTIGANGGKSINFIWAAMYEGEYTADNLPPYVPKGYTAELAECQRRFVNVANGIAYGVATVNGRFIVTLPLNSPIIDDIVPTVSITSAMWLYTSTGAVLGTPTTYKRSGNGITIEGTCDTSIHTPCVVPDIYGTISLDL